MATASSAGNRCRRPGCAGAIDPDGYCDQCGRRAAPTTRTSSSRTTGTGGTGVLGTGLADLPPVPVRDPAEVVLKDPAVPESGRFCGQCERPVGRGRDGRDGRLEGFCPFCGTRFSFTPTLRPGDLVAGQYEVQGCLAHGGLGWIYLAADRNLDGMWVVLKGLINTHDRSAFAAVEAEKRFLTTVDHPNIVKILNFVQHREPGTGAAAGYLVMEYVGGVSLHDLLSVHTRTHGGPLPARQAIPYALEALAALDYLHGRGLLYCDLKPDNLIQVEQRLKLIDLGAVRRIDEPYGDIWGTAGYQAPEIADQGPSVRSDLHTVGRTLAVLSLGLRPSAPLPSPAPDQPDSFHRLLRRATDPDPVARFGTATELAGQLTGVLRELRAAEDGVPYPAPSQLFGPERGAVATDLADHPRRPLADLDPAEAVAGLPAPLPDPADPAASALTGLVGRDPEQLLAVVESLPASPEAILARVRVLTDLGRPAAATALADAERQLPGDWRVGWYQAVHALATGRDQAAVERFDRCLDRLPGECAPKLGLAFSLERAGRRGPAAGWYETVWRTDHGYVSAAFGLARTRPAAVEVLDQVPASSSYHVTAQLALVVAAVRVAAPEPAALAAAGQRLARLTRLDPAQRVAVAAELLEAALALVGHGRADPGHRVLDAPLTERGIRPALERVYRELARAAATRPVRRLLVDRANTVRPRTWL
jgi:serine/threonine-protein kinase PknG